MDKQYKEFEAYVPCNFRDLMIDFWMKDENCSRELALSNYDTEGFRTLCNRIEGQIVSFKPDLGYLDKSLEGTLCFDREDDNIIIPLSTLRDPELSMQHAMQVIKSAMIEDGAGERGSVAHSWHCNIAMMCYDAMHAAGYTDHYAVHKTSNDAASRFMKLCFDVETKA